VPTARTEIDVDKWRWLDRLVEGPQPWRDLGHDARRAVILHARAGQPYPDPPVAGVAVEWASRLLGEPLWRRLLRAGWGAAIAYAALGVPFLLIWLLGAQLSIERGYAWAGRMIWTLGCFAYLLGPRRWAAARAVLRLHSRPPSQVDAPA
jgi:hypothetical protein